jgi:hypothetical protein
MILGLQQALPGAWIYMWSRNNVPTQDEILKPSVLRGILLGRRAVFPYCISIMPFYVFTFSLFSRSFPFAFFPSYFSPANDMLFPLLLPPRSSSAVGRYGHTFLQGVYFIGFFFNIYTVFMVSYR